MQDVSIDLTDGPGALAQMGRVLSDAGISVEGGGVFVTGGRGVAHFLFHDGTAAAETLAVEVVERVEPALLFAPVEPVGPVREELLQLGQVGVLRPHVARRCIGPTSALDPCPQVVGCLLRETYDERVDMHRRINAAHRVRRSHRHGPSVPRGTHDNPSDPMHQLRIGLRDAR